MGVAQGDLRKGVTSRKTLDFAVELVKHYHAFLYILHILDVPGMSILFASKIKLEPSLTDQENLVVYITHKSIFCSKLPFFSNPLT